MCNVWGIPAHIRIGRSYTPPTAVVGSNRIPCPTPGSRIPERRRTAGVWIAPAARTTAWAFTFTGISFPLLRWTASTPATAPSFRRSARASVSNRNFAPWRCASGRYVTRLDFFAEYTHPKLQ